MSWKDADYTKCDHNLPKGSMEKYKLVWMKNYTSIDVCLRDFRWALARPVDLRISEYWTRESDHWELEGDREFSTRCRINHHQSMINHLET